MRMDLVEDAGIRILKVFEELGLTRDEAKYTLEALLESTPTDAELLSLINKES